MPPPRRGPAEAGIIENYLYFTTNNESIQAQYSAKIQSILALPKLADIKKIAPLAEHGGFGRELAFFDIFNRGNYFFFHFQQLLGRAQKLHFGVVVQIIENQRANFFTV